MVSEIASCLPAFYRIPAELLTEFARPFFDKSSPDYSQETLKILRASCPQFAYLSPVQAKLFRSIRLRASLEDVEWLETFELARLAPFVKCISFVPLRYSWAITFDLFKKIIALQNPPTGQSYQLFSPNQIKEGFEFYISHANNIKALYNSDRLEKAWIVALQALPRTEYIRIGCLDYDYHDSQPTQVPRCHVNERFIGNTRMKSEHTALAATVGDALLTTVAVCVASVDKKPKTLEVGCVFNGGPDWLHRPKWASISLDGLKELIFCPGDEAYDGLFCPDHRDDVVDTCATTLASILEKCQHTLTSLGICVPASMEYGETFIWPPHGQAVVALPKLESLWLSDMDLRPREFASFLLKAKSLQCLDMSSTNLDGGNYSEYKYIWNAIRHHEKRMLLKFSEIIGNDAMEISLSYNTGDVIVFGDSNKGIWFAAEEALNKYLAGSGRWTQPLRWYFDGEDENEVGGDDSSNVDEMETDGDD